MNELKHTIAVGSGDLLGHRINDMKKVIQITMPDGSLWQVPAAIIAGHRSEYYASHYGDNKQLEYENTISDDSEILDWAANNMNWKDAAHAAVKVRDGRLDYQEGWVNGPKSVVEVPNEKS